MSYCMCNPPETLQPLGRRLTARQKHRQSVGRNALRLGLPWPESGRKRGAGRPTSLTQHHNATHAALKNHEFDVIDALVSGDTPRAESEPAPGSVTDTTATSLSTLSSPSEALTVLHEQPAVVLAGQMQQMSKFLALRLVYGWVSFPPKIVAIVERKVR